MATTIGDSQATTDRWRSVLEPLAARLRQASAEELVELVWADQRQRWMAGQRIPAEAYLECGGATLTLDDRVDIVYAEALLGRELNLAVQLEDFTRRFPEIANQLAQQWHFDDLFGSCFPAVSLNGKQLPHQFSTDSPLVPTQLPENTAIEGAKVRKRPEISPEVTTIGKYRIISRLGGGSQAEVFRALHPTLQRDVVIKLAHGPTPPGDRDLVVDEGRILAQIEHAHVAKVYDVDFHGERAYLVTEYVTGRNLEQVVKDGVLSGRAAARLVAQVARGMGEIHRRGILHRDLKPGNILLTSEGQAKVVDFGLARMEHAYAKAPDDSGAIIGSLLYMSPEQAAGGETNLTPASDVYSLGGTLFFLLTGRPPIAATTASEALIAARAGKWNQGLLASLAAPEQLKRVCRRALALEPNERFVSADALAQELEAFVKAKPISKLVLAASLGLLSVAAAVALALAAFPHVKPLDDMKNQIASKSGGEVRRSLEPPITTIHGPLLDVRVWSQGAAGNGRFRDLVDAVPLATGNEVTLSCDVPAGHDAALYGLTSSGELQLLTSSTRSQEAGILRFPAGPSQTVPLVGPPGTELLVFILSREGPVPIASLNAIAAEMRRRWPSLSSKIVLRVTPEGVEAVQGARDFGAPHQHEDPDETIREQLIKLRAILADKCSYFEAIAFLRKDS